MHNKIEQLDFEPGGDTDQAWHEMDLLQNSMLLSVSKELPRFGLKGVKKSAIELNSRYYQKTDGSSPSLPRTKDHSQKSEKGAQQ